MFDMGPAEGVTFAGNYDRCPKCDQPSIVMEGRFDFDGHGIASVISAPTWSRDALLEVQSDLLAMARAAEDPRYSDARVSALIDTRLERMEERAELRDREQRELILGLKEEIQTLHREESRSRLQAVLRSLGSVVGVVAAISGAIQGAAMLADWATTVINAAQTVSLDDLPSEILAPGERPGPPV